LLSEFLCSAIFYEFVRAVLCGALILRPRGDGQVWWILLRMWNS